MLTTQHLELQAENEQLKARVAELTTERNALRASIKPDATCEFKMTYEELHASWLVMVERAKAEAKRADKAEYKITSLQSQLDCGQDGDVCAARAPGCNRHWEQRNRELVARVAELERALSCDGLLKGILSRWRSDTEAQAVAIEELQKSAIHWDCARCDGTGTEMPTLLAKIADLESQLAWTPVSAGLPTEPGCYLFSNRGGVSLFTVGDDGSFAQHVDEGTELWDASPMSYWREWLRIELPGGAS